MAWSESMSTRLDIRRFRSLVMVAIAIVAAAVLAMGLTIWGLRADAVEDASRDVGHIATILAEQPAHSIKASDETLPAIQGRLVAAHETAPESFNAAIRSAETHQVLADRIARLPQASIFAIISAEGHTVNDSRDWPALDIDVSDRDFFAVHKARTSPGLYVSPLLTSRGDKSKMLFFSRRLDSRRGEFLGMSVIGVQ